MAEIGQAAMLDQTQDQIELQSPLEAGIEAADLDGSIPLEQPVAAMATGKLSSMSRLKAGSPTAHREAETAKAHRG